MPRILIIEDEDEIRGIIRQVLKDAGYEVDDAPDGIPGTRRHQEKPADLINAISGGDGIGPQPYLEIAQGLGADRVFMKPFGIQELLMAVGELVG